jgi:hypothetical protein
MPPPSSAPPSSSNTRSRSSSAAAAAATASSYTQPTSTALSNYTEEPGTVLLHANGKSTVINLSSSSSPHEIASLTQPTTATTTSTSTTTVDSPKKRKKSKHQLRRKGFWNRRGDHVTADGYIVYAPPDLVYPPDLDGYPDGKDEGYMNEDGHITSWHKRPAYNPPRGYSSVESFYLFIFVNLTLIQSIYSSLTMSSLRPSLLFSSFLPDCSFIPPTPGAIFMLTLSVPAVSSTN